MSWPQLNNHSYNTLIFLIHTVYASKLKNEIYEKEFAWGL